MPSWKKLIVSGSDATLNSLQVTTNVTAAGFSGSFSGSFQGDGSQLTFPQTGILSSSAQIASEISGAFTSVSESIALDIAGLIQDSGSFSTRITDLENFSSSADSIFVSEVEFALASGSFLVTASVSDDTITLVKGDSSTFNLIVDNVNSASYAGNADLLDGRDSLVFATTGSNTFYGNQIISGNLDVTGSFRASGFNYPTSDGPFGVEVLTSDGTGNITFEIPETLYEEVKSDAIVTLPKGTPVKVTGVVGNQALVVAADASNPALMPATYILAQELAPQEEGLGIILGRISNINTNGLTAGEVVYVAPGGGYTQTRPTGSALVQPLGLPINIATNGGSGVVMNPGVANDLPNLTPGHFWVGGNNSVPTTVASSSFAKVGENNIFTGTQTFNNLVVNGTGSFAYIQSVTGSANIIGDAFILLNEDTPTQRFAGIKVVDSGSSFTTSSFIYDGVENQWIFQHEGTLNSGSAVAIFGPLSQGGLGSEIGLTENRIPKAVTDHGHHIADSNISDDGVTVTVNSSLNVTGAVTSSAVIYAIGGFEGNLTGNASTATSASHAVNADTASLANFATTAGTANTASYVDWTDIDNVPAGLVSSSTQISYLGITDIPAGIISSSTQLNNSTLSGMVISGSFSGSFQGDGSGLTGIVSEIEATKKFTVQFTSQSTVTVNHLLNSDYPFVQVYDSNKEVFVPQTVESLGLNSVRVDFSGSSSGYIIVGKGGFLVADYTQEFTNTTTVSVTHSLNEDLPFVQVFGTDDQLLIPQGIKVVDSNTVRVDFSSNSSGYVAVSKGGYTVFDLVNAVSVREFVNASSITLNCSSYSEFPFIQVYESGSNEQIIPLGITKLDVSTVQVTFSQPYDGFISFPRTGHVLDNVSRLDGKSGSYYLDYSNFINVPAVSSFPYTGSAIISGSLEVIGPVTGSTFTGSFVGDGSGLTGVGGDSFPYTGSAIISGSLQVIGPISGSFVGDGSGLTGLSVSIEDQTVFPQSFTLTSSVVVNHLLDTVYPLVQVYNTDDEQLIPQRIKVLNSSSVQVDFPIPKSGYVVVAKGGHVVSGSAINSLLLENQSGSYYLDYNNFTNVPVIDNFPYTGSAEISGSLNVTGPISSSGNIVPVTATQDLGTLANPWREIFVTTGSIKFVDDGEVVRTVTAGNLVTTESLVQNLPAGILSSSAQLTASLDQRYVLSGSITQTTWDNIDSKPAGIVSSSAQLNNSTLSGMSITGSFTGSFAGDGSAITGVTASVVQVASYAQTFTSVGSVTVGHNLNTTSPIVQVYNAADRQFLPEIIEIVDSNTVQVTFSTTSSGKVVVAKGGHIVQGTSENALELDGEQPSFYLDYNNFTNVPAGIVSGSSQISYTGITNVPAGIVSGSSQLNNSTLTGMTVSGSFSGSFQGDGSGLTNTGITTSELYAHSFLLMGG